ncbi:MAG: methyl-viologen-reducing hydrogenase subunit delta, heterodisulfide reductase subunit A [Candidatus Rokubacteria bacterium CSP1-6]|nr:MAG: methyl-viologen-reducing hydrogenase subunit delta, heterodisulfide reductase subunit A [Candidatus Rokubacteria bacterium CSP1-6]
MEKKLGVYVCGGCGIGECVDKERLVRIAAEEYQVSVVKTSPAFCLEDVRLIKEDIEKEGVNAVVIAACSPRVNTDVFALPSATVERVNLREQVAWSHPPGHEETQSLANDALRIGIVRAQKTRPPTPFTEANERTVLVIGGGVAGMTAALGAARSSVKAILVEKTPRLGGFAARLWKQVPKHPPYRDLEEPGVDALIRETEAHPDIQVLTGAEVQTIAGQPGKFEVSIRRDGEVRSVTAGAVVLATGWRPFDATALERYGFGKSPNVVTNVTLEEMARTGKLTRPSDGKEVKTVAILQCDGSGDEANAQYSASVTYLVSLKHATYIRERCPDASVYVIYRDMQTPGMYEYFYKKVQEDPGVLFTRGTVKEVLPDAAGGLVVEVEGSPLGGGVRLAVDLLVLATGMVPVASESEGLNLAYLQGKGLPVSKYGFADSNFLCFPYETRRTGIYSAGCVRKPMDLTAAALDGSAAALKAIQAVEKSSAGAAVHPRVGDLSYPSFFLQQCTMCGRCSQECPFGAIELVPEKNTPFVVTNRCRRCGICMGACPVQIISFDDYTVDMVASMIKAVEIPEGDEEKPRILVLACENDAYPALDMAGINRLQLPASLRVIPVRCLGSVNAIMAADAFSRGFDGVLLLGCKSGDDYQCHFIKGSELLATRMENVRETLGRLMLEPERATVMDVEISGFDRLPDRLAEFVASIKAVGLNPMKGF